MPCDKPTIDGTPGDEGRYLITITVTKGPDKGKTFQVDPYDLIDSIGFRNIAHGQALKKMMRGGRAGKDWLTDIGESIESAQRSIQRESFRSTNDGNNI